MKLGDVLELHRGYDLPKGQRVDGEVPVISSSGISGSHNVAKCDGANVVTGRYGTIGEVFFHEGPCWPLNTTLYVSDFKGNDERYIYYLLKYALGTLMRGDGRDKSTVPGVDRNVLHMMDVPFEPDPACQKELVSLLFAIDAKIETNAKVIAELDSLARTVYDYWFTQFDFPDENGNPYHTSGGKMVWNEALKREIPAGWEVAALGDYLELEKGYSYSSDELVGNGTPMINLASVTRQRTYNPSGLKYLKLNGTCERMVEPGDMLIACTDLTRQAEIVGSPIFVPTFYEGYVYSMDLAKISIKDDKMLPGYLYMILRTPAYRNYIKGFVSGTNVQHLDVNGIYWRKAVLPPMELQDQYDVIVIQDQNEASRLMVESASLSALRDYLLPMLMNGQATIDE